MQISIPLDLSAWNHALLEAVFRAGDLRTGAIRRINVTDAFIASAIGYPLDRAAAAREGLIAAFRRNYPAGRYIFDHYLLTRRWDPGSMVPPFFVNLYLSLIVASATEETWQEANFRRRLAALLEQDVNRDLVGAGLPRLWRDLEDWSRSPTARQAGYRELRLPSPGNERIIGYSKRLAFPRFDDLNRLAGICAREELDVRSPLYTIVRTISAERNRFSERFQEEFDLFHALVRTDRRSAIDTPFWDAFAEVSWSPVSFGSGGPSAAASLALDLTDLSAPRLNLLRKDDRGRQPGLERLELSGADGYAYLEFDPDSWEIFGGGRHPWSRLIARSLHNAIRNECVCFGPGEDVAWTWSRTLPEVGPAWIVARRTLADQILSSARNAGIEKVGRYPIREAPGWLLVGRLIYDSRSRRELLQELPPELLFLDVFKQAAPIPRIYLYDTIRLPEGILCLRPQLPKVSVAGAERVTIHSVARDSTAFDGELIPVGTGLFESPPEVASHLSLPTDVDLKAWAGDDVLASSRRYFIRRHSSLAPLPPTDLADWLMEGESGQLEPADGRAHQSIQRNPAGAVLAHQARVGLVVGDVPIPEHRWVPLIGDVPDEWGDILEVLTAQGSLKRGLDWPELKEIVECGLGIRPHLAHAVIQTLADNGIVCRLFRRRWRGSRFFVQSMAGYTVSHSEGTELRLVGAHSRLMREQLLDAAARFGASDVSVALSEGDVGIGAIRIRGVSGSDSEQLCRDLSVPVTHVSASGGELSPPSKILGSGGGLSAHSGLEPTWWHPSEMRFLPSPARDSEFSLERRGFANGQSEYILYRAGVPSWRTSSPRWARLVGMVLVSRQEWTITTEGTLLSRVPLPYPFSREVLLRGAGICSTARHSTPGTRFLYSFASVDVAMHLMRAWIAADEPLDEAVGLWVRALSQKTGPRMLSHLERRYRRPS